MALPVDECIFSKFYLKNPLRFFLLFDRHTIVKKKKKKNTVTAKCDAARLKYVFPLTRSQRGRSRAETRFYLRTRVTASTQ